MAARFRVAGICFEHMHMGDNLRMAAEHPDCEVVAICDEQPERMQAAQNALGLQDSQVFTDWQQCMQAAAPDLVLLCPSTGDHALWVERLAPLGKPLLMEKPMAASLADADRMIQAATQHSTPLAINWPLVWVPVHRTAKRLIDEGRIGQLIEVHHYGGNRGPLWHTAGKEEVSAEEVAQQKPYSWFYQRETGGGSLLDYLGYGATLGTWFLNGAKPIDVTAVVDEPAGLQVDEHSITVARYSFGMSKFETRWGTFTDPWTHQPQPKCGFVLVGTEGTISSYDYGSTVMVQDRQQPAGVEIPAERSPARVFQALFVAGTKEEVSNKMTELQRGKSILDTVLGDAKSLDRRLGATDRHKLQEYFSAIRDLEGELQQSEQWVQKPKPEVDVEPTKDVPDKQDITARQRVMYDLIALTLQTDSTRIVTYLQGALNSPPSNIRGVSNDWHALSHHGRDETKIAELKLIEEAQLAEFNRFLGKLRGFKEGDNSLLDNTAVLFGSNLGNASSHNCTNLPIMVAGGGYKHGSHIVHDQKNNTPLSNLFVSLAQRMGVETDQFGSSTAAGVKDFEPNHG